MISYRESHLGNNRGKLYDERYDRGADRFYWHNFERPLLRKLFFRLSENHDGRYLDFACGTGRVLNTAASYFHYALGIDVSKDMLAEARNKCPHADLKLRDVTVDRLQLEPFDVVSMFRFILNAEPDLRVKALEWIRSVIKPDGVLVINNHRNKWSLRGMRSVLGNLRRNKHVNVLSDRDVKKLLKQCGFAVKKSYGFAFLLCHKCLPMPRGLLRVVESVLIRIPGLQRVAQYRIYLCDPV